MMYVVNQSDAAEMRSRIDKVNRWATDNGVDPIEYTESEPQRVNDDPDGNSFHFVVEFDCGDSEAPRFDGWSVIGRVDWLADENGKRVPFTSSRQDDVENPTECRCEHCGTIRHRNTTFIVERDGNRQQVGSTCLKKYTGIVPSWIAHWEDELDGLGAFADGSRGSDYFDYPTYLTLVAAHIDCRGWVARWTKFDDGEVERNDGATADLVWVTMMTGGLEREKSQKYRRDMEAAITDDLRDEVDAAIEWAKNLNEDTGYLSQLHDAMTLAGVHAKTNGIVASVIPAYRRAMQQERDTAERGDGLTPEGRIEVAGTILSLNWKDNGYGVSLKMVVEHADGWRVWGSVPAAFEDDVEVGDGVSFTATVTPADDDRQFGFFKRPSKFAKK